MNAANNNPKGKNNKPQVKNVEKDNKKSLDANLKKNKSPKTAIKSSVEKLDIASLDENELSSLMLHCASVLHFRNAMATPGATLAQKGTGCCYTKSGNDTTVSLWRNGFKVGETSQANADANGIPPCGG